MYYGFFSIAVTLFIVCIIFTVITLVRRKDAKKMAWLTSGAFLLQSFAYSTYYYDGISAKGMLETAVEIPIAVGIFFLIFWLGRRRQRGAHDTGK